MSGNAFHGHNKVLLVIISEMQLKPGAHDIPRMYFPLLIIGKGKLYIIVVL
jgi:hypothetical protein